MAVTVAPRRLASCTTADPTPPDAPATSTCSPLDTFRPVDHVFSRTVGTWDRAKFGIAPIAVHRENLSGRHFHELRECAVEIGSHPDILQGLPSRTANAWPHQCAQANGAFISTRGNGDNTPATIRALDKWKWRRLVPSTVRLCFRLFFLSSCQSFCTGGDRGRVPAEAGIDFSIVYPAARTCRRSSPGASVGTGTSRYSSFHNRRCRCVTTAFMVVWRNASFVLDIKAPLIFFSFSTELDRRQQPRPRPNTPTSSSLATACRTTAIYSPLTPLRYRLPSTTRGVFPTGRYGSSTWPRPISWMPSW
jgi:hypothetical protein